MKNTRKLCAALMACIGFSATVSADPATRDVDALLASQAKTFVHVDRCGVDFDVPPVIVNSRTFVEANGLFNQLNIDLSWRQSDQRVTGVASNGSTFHLWIGSTTAWLNGSYVTLDAAPFIATPYNRTMVPLSFVSLATGASVHWRNSGRTVDVFAGINKNCYMSDLQDLAELTWRGYYGFNEAGPIGVTPATLIKGSGAAESVYVVTMSGTDLDRVRQAGDATGIYEDILIGFFGSNNSYTQNVVNVINSRIPRGSKLVLAGHSLGGMVAQQVAAHYQIKADYQILNTVTYGSPLIGAGTREGTVKRFGDENDLVPYLSLEGTILAPWQVYGLNGRDGGYGISGTVKAHTESYRRDNVWAGYDVLGHTNSINGLVYNPANVRFYAAPGL